MMIELLEARAQAAGLQLDGRVMDHHALDLPDDSFDIAASQNGVTMSPYLGTALAQMTRVTRPGGTVLVAAFGPLPKVEFLSMFIAGVRAAVPGFASPPIYPPPPPFQLADPDVFAQALGGAGLRKVTIETVTWDIPVASGADLWDEVTSSNPIGAQLVADLDEGQQADVLTVLDSVLRERFGDRSGGLLQVAVNVGIGTV